MNFLNKVVPQVINSERFDRLLSAKIPSYMSFIKRIPEQGIALVGMATDLVSQENYSFLNTITSYALETGTTISDHIINGPLIVSQTFSVFNMPHFGRSMVQASVIHKLLLELRKSQELFTLRTSIGSYHNMAIERLDISRIGADGTTLSVNIRFREVIYYDISENQFEIINPTQELKSPNKTFNASAQPAKQSGTITPRPAQGSYIETYGREVAQAWGNLFN